MTNHPETVCVAAQEEEDSWCHHANINADFKAQSLQLRQTLHEDVT